MPAKAEHLSSGWTRFSKLMAALFGAYLATIFLHLSIAKMLVDDTPVIITSTYSTFLVWCGFMIMIYLIKKAWISWAILLSIISVGSLLIFMS
ncbi:MAG: hypothetical protein HRU41_00360 [Saprospiraceae bacterium]|nr:hypothetical protein [Saprospiraceae bacterium]